MTISKASSIFSIILVSTCLLLGWLIIELDGTSKTNSDAVSQELSLNILASELSNSSKELTSLVRIFAVTASPQAEQAYLAVVSERSGKTPRLNSRTIAPGESISLIELMDIYGCTPKELEKVNMANELSNNLIALETEAMNAVKGLFKDSSGKYTIQKEPDRVHAVNLVFSEQYNAELVKIQKPLSEFFTMLSERTKNETAESVALVNRATLFLAILIIFVLSLSILSAWYSRCIVCIPLTETTKYIKRVASGDLKQEFSINSNNEIGVLTKSISLMIKNLLQLIKKADDKTEEATLAMHEVDKADKATAIAKSAQLAEATRRENMLETAKQLESVVHATTVISDELSEQITQSEEGAINQASRISSTASAVEEMNSSVSEVAQNAESAAKISVDTRMQATEGTAVVLDCISAINLVEVSASALKSDMDILTAHAQEINQIMNVISDIADQTNLLALNAAIEAARAGDAGRGFAVVADEVRKLAEKTMNSTSDVGNTIRSIQKSTESSMGKVEDTVENIARATELVEQCGTTLHKIVNFAETTATQVQDIATASNQQAVVSGEIALSISEINLISEKTAQTMQKATQVVSGLTGQTQQLNTLIVHIKES